MRLRLQSSGTIAGWVNKPSSSRSISGQPGLHPRSTGRCRRRAAAAREVGRHARRNRSPAPFKTPPCRKVAGHGFDLRGPRNGLEEDVGRCRRYGAGAASADGPAERIQPLSREACRAPALWRSRRRAPPRLAQWVVRLVDKAMIASTSSAARDNFFCSPFASRLIQEGEIAGGPESPASAHP